jgi:hypothetical protein
MSSEFMNAPGALLFATLFMLGIVLAVRRDSALAVAFAGAAGGFCFTIRPYTAVAICLVPSLVCIGHILRRRSWKAVVAGLMGAALPLLFFGAYNLATTGDALVLGYEKMAAASPPGQATATWGGSIWNVLARDSLKTLNAMNKDLFQLPFPGLVLAAAAFAFRRPSFWDFVLLLSFLSLLGFYFFYFAHGDMYLGPRYLVEGISALAILSARGLVAIREQFGHGAIPEARRQALLLAAAVGVLLVFPAAMAARIHVVLQHYADSTIVRAAERQHLENAVVFVPAKRGTRWVACFAANSPTLDGSVVFARDLGARNEELMELYPGRSAHRWDPDEDRLLEIR